MQRTWIFLELKSHRRTLVLRHQDTGFWFCMCVFLLWFWFCPNDVGSHTPPAFLATADLQRETATELVTPVPGISPGCRAQFVWKASGIRTPHPRALAWKFGPGKSSTAQSQGSQEIPAQGPRPPRSSSSSEIRFPFTEVAV